MRNIFDYAMVSTMKRAGAAGTRANRITLLRDADGDGVAEIQEVFLENLNQPFGMAMLDDTFYVGNTDGLVPFPYATGTRRITAPGRTLATFKPHVDLARTDVSGASAGERAAQTMRADHDVPRWLARGAGWSWRLLVVVAAIASVMYVVSHLLVAVVPLVGALFGAAILIPPASWLRDRGTPPLLATWIVFLVAFAIGAGLAWWLVPSVGSEIPDLRGTLVQGLDQVRTWLTGAPLHLSTAQVDAVVGRIRAQTSASGAILLHGAIAGALLVLEIVASCLLTIVLTFFFVKDGGSLAAWLGGFAEPSRRDRMQGAATLAWQTFTAYVQGTAINGLVNGTLMGLGLSLLGVPLAIPIAVITFFGGFFPLVGGIISGGVAVLVALSAKGIGGALQVIVLTILIHNVEGYIVGPFVLGRKVKLHAVVIVLALSVGTVVGGVFGAFIAVPVDRDRLGPDRVLSRPAGRGRRDGGRGQIASQRPSRRRAMGIAPARAGCRPGRNGTVIGAGTTTPSNPVRSPTRVSEAWRRESCGCAPRGGPRTHPLSRRSDQ